MGLNIMAAEFLVSALAAGVKVNSICTLGRLNLRFTRQRALALLEQYGLQVGPTPKEFEWAEDFFTLLGIDERESIDFSNYESPTIVHDLNKPLPTHLKGRFDLVLDGGTLEHIFNFPIAIKNAMGMVATNGHLMLDTTFNNLCGHGFYQFCPELFYRVFSEDNGFKMLRMYVYVGNGLPHHVVDPASIKKRVMLINNESTMALVHAKKIATAKIFAVTPQQSDYVGVWQEHATGRPETHDRIVKSFLRKKLTLDQIAWISRRLQPWRQRRNVRKVVREASLTNAEAFKPVMSWKDGIGLDI